MPKEEWGVKRACPKCAVRFYDLKNDPMTCPSCAATFDVASLTQQKTRSATPEKASKVLETAETDDVDDLDEVVVLDDEDDSTESIGDDLLEDDDDDTVPLEEIADVASNDDDN